MHFDATCIRLAWASINSGEVNDELSLNCAFACFSLLPLLSTQGRKAAGSMGLNSLPEDLTWSKRTKRGIWLSSSSLVPVCLTCCRASPGVRVAWPSWRFLPTRDLLGTQSPPPTSQPKLTESFLQQKSIRCCFRKGSGCGAAHGTRDSAGSAGQCSTAVPGAPPGIHSVAQGVILINEVYILLVWHWESLWTEQTYREDTISAARNIFCSGVLQNPYFGLLLSFFSGCRGRKT